MEVERSRIRLDDDVQSLVGQRLTSVAYFEIAHDDPLPLWNGHSDFDSLDFGVELRFESGQACWISWGDDFYTYALKIELHSHEDRGRMREWNVSQASRWERLIGEEVTGSKIHWDWQRVGSGPVVWGPQDLELTFRSGAAVFISAMLIEPGRDPFGHTDTVTVIFGEQLARRYAVGRFARMRNEPPGNTPTT